MSVNDAITSRWCAAAGRVSGGGEQVGTGKASLAAGHCLSYINGGNIFWGQIQLKKIIHLIELKLR